MAEFVDKRLQDLVPFFEELKRSELFSAKEINKIINNHKDHEHRIQKTSRSLDDVLRYVDFEMRLLELITTKRKMANFYHKMQEIDEELKRRINSQFGSAKMTFKHDLRVWNAHLEFLQKQNWMSLVSTLHRELIINHGSKRPFLYKNASQHEFDVDPEVGITAARSILQEGIRAHPKCDSLFVEAFLLELKYINYLHEHKRAMDNVLSERNGENIVYKLLLAKTIYKNSKKHCMGIGKANAELFVRFYIVTSPYSFAEEMLRNILKDLESECNNEEDAFDFLAKIELNNKDIRKAIEYYDKGIQLNPTTKMYNFYVNTLYRLIKNSSSNHFITKANEICERGHNDSKLSEESYLIWCWITVIESALEKSALQDTENVETCLSSKNGFRGSRPVEEVINLGLEKHPSSWQLINELIKLNVNTNLINPQQVLKKLSNIDVKSEDSLCVWKFVFNLFAAEREHENYLLMLVNKARNPKIKSSLRILLLTHMFYLGEYEKGRKFYNDESISPPTSFEFHETMAKLELLYMDSRKVAYDNIRRCHENATNSFGESHIVAWLNYINFERRITGDDKRATTIYHRALSKLRRDLQEKFILEEQGLRSKKRFNSSFILKAEESSSESE